MSRASAIDHLSVWAVRYALGRMTYAVGDVVDTLLDHQQDLTAKSKAVIVRDIDEALAEKRTGMQMDTDQWIRLRNGLASVKEVEG